MPGIAIPSLGTYVSRNEGPPIPRSSSRRSVVGSKRLQRPLIALIDGDVPEAGPVKAKRQTTAAREKLYGRALVGEGLTLRWTRRKDG